MSSDRQTRLVQNFSSMFWMNVFLNLKFINIILSIFYISRGLAVHEIFYLAIIWAVTNLLFEIPSSYIADRWGRKKTILLSVILFNLYYLGLLFAQGFVQIGFAIFVYALSYALLTGTEEALIYDTNRELGNTKGSLSEFGKYFSARHVFKIIIPVLGAFIAQDLSDGQFRIILLLDFAMSFLALFFALRLTEPKHHMDLEEMEAGIFNDAWKILKKNTFLARAILSRVLMFIALFILWTFHQEFFVAHGVSIVVLGLAWSLGHLFSFFINRNVEYIFGGHIRQSIHTLNYIIALLLVLLAVGFYVPIPIYLSLAIFMLADHLEVIRWPVYAEYFNNFSKSFNRATTLSLINFSKSILDIPLLFIASVLVGADFRYVFIFSAVLGFVVVVLFRLPKLSNV